MGSDRIEYKFLIELAELLDKYDVSIDSINDYCIGDTLVEFDFMRKHVFLETDKKYVYSSDLYKLAEKYKND